MASLMNRLIHWLATRFELQRGSPGSNLLTMEGLRGFAVFLVFLVHFGTLVEPWLVRTSMVTTLVTAGRTIGHAGVDLFFVLSGYLIYGTLISRRQAFGRYFWRRLQRIYPAFLAVFAIYLILCWIFHKESKLPQDGVDAAWYVLQNLLFLPGLLPIEPLITVAWSLSYEVFYYAAMPVLVVLLRLRRWQPIQRVWLFASFSVLALVLGAIHGGHIRMVMFLAGVLLWDVVKHRLWPPVDSGFALACALMALACMTLPIEGPQGQAVRSAALFVGFTLLCLASFTAATGWFGNLWTWIPLRWLGNMSYSYYLVHGLALKAVFIALGKLVPAADAWPAFAAWVLVPAFLLSLLPLALLFLWVERPLSLATAPHGVSNGKQLVAAGEHG